MMPRVGNIFSRCAGRQAFVALDASGKMLGRFRADFGFAQAVGRKCHRVSRHSSSPDVVVASDVARDQPEEWNERAWPPTGSWTGQLQDGVADAPQAAPGDGAPRPGAFARRGGGR